MHLVFDVENQNKSNNICFLAIAKSAKIHLVLITNQKLKTHVMIDEKTLGGPTLNLFFALEVVKQNVLGGIQRFFNITLHIKFKTNQIQFVIS